jgi:4-oxalomesaconate tautomerase
MMQKAIPYMQFRGGSSKGLYFKASDLPDEEELLHKVILAAMEGEGKGDDRQIDGMGGANSLTSKVAIVSRSKTKETDLDYLFLQVVIGKGKVSTTQTCGNILAGVVPFAIESGIIKPGDPVTIAKVNIVNTGGVCEVIVQTPGGFVEYAGDVRVDGVPGTGAPVICNYLDTMGSTTGQLLPTGNMIDTIQGVKLTCIDNGMPLVILRAADLGISGYETKEELDKNTALKKKLEQIRLETGPLMNLGDVHDQTIPKMCLISSPRQGGIVNTRMFIPHVCHEAIGVLAAVSVATACIMPGTVADDITVMPAAGTRFFNIEHPSGDFTVNLEFEYNREGINIKKSGVIRTARLISKGLVYIPGSVKV